MALTAAAVRPSMTRVSGTEGTISSKTCRILIADRVLISYHHWSWAQFNRLKY
jgi:hypothetical protein